ncbi:YfgM family protein [Salinivibrio sp. VYel1]|uniref:YfgM family protein n=1 Tax=Salinivibrio sp. VYel1 TaxID=2490490 RepID=UPI00351AFAF3|nr:tetratricopeptide repeat protein [Salinivibrio sp. VYel1]
MDVYTTEEQQVEAIKKWWRDNGKAVVIGAVVGLGALYGWRYFQSQQLTSQEQASQQYEQVLSGIESGDTVSLSQLEGHEGYRALAALQLAQKHVAQGELESAREQLQNAQQAVKDEALYGLVTTRLARVEAELGNYSAALSELDKVTTQSWTAKVEEIRGDVLLRQGDKQAARDAYAASLAAAESPTVNMKLDNLSQ